MTLLTSLAWVVGQWWPSTHCPCQSLLPHWVYPEDQGCKWTVGDAGWFFRGHWCYLLVVQMGKLKPCRGRRELDKSHDPLMLNLDLILHRILLPTLNVVRSLLLLRRWKMASDNKSWFLTTNPRKIECFSKSLAWIQRDLRLWRDGWINSYHPPILSSLSFCFVLFACFLFLSPMGFANPQIWLSPVMWLSQEHGPARGSHDGLINTANNDNNRIVSTCAYCTRCPSKSFACINSFKPHNSYQISLQMRKLRHRKAK